MKDYARAKASTHAFCKFCDYSYKCLGYGKCFKSRKAKSKAKNFLRKQAKNEEWL